MTSTGGRARGDEVRLDVPRDTYYLASIRSLVAAVARHAGFGERETRQIVLAVDEACAVAVSNRHDRATDAESGEVRRIPRANKVTLVLRTDARRLEARVIDHGGEGAGWSALEQAVADEEGGLGYLIISTFMDEIELADSPRGREVILTRLRGRASGRLPWRERG